MDIVLIVADKVSKQLQNLLQDVLQRYTLKLIFNYILENKYYISCKNNKLTKENHGAKINKTKYKPNSIPFYSKENILEPNSIPFYSRENILDK